MTDLDPVFRALGAGGVGATDVASRRGNEVHCLVPPRDVARLFHVALDELGADLILMAADDRRRESGAFFVHYLFAHRTGHWFLHASVRVDGPAHELPSVASVCYPASRFEREIRDLFGFHQSYSGNDL